MFCAYCGADISHLRVDAKACSRQHKLLAGKRRQIDAITGAYLSQIESDPDLAEAHRALLRLKRAVRETKPRQEDRDREG